MLLEMQGQHHDRALLIHWKWLHTLHSLSFYVKSCIVHFPNSKSPYSMWALLCEHDLVLYYTDRPAELWEHVGGTDFTNLPQQFAMKHLVSKSTHTCNILLC